MNNFILNNLEIKMYNSYTVYMLNNSICQSVLLNTCLMLLDDSYLIAKCGDYANININGIDYSNCSYTMYNDSNCNYELYTKMIPMHPKCGNLYNSETLFNADWNNNSNSSMIIYISCMVIIFFILTILSLFCYYTLFNICCYCTDRLSEEYVNSNTTPQDNLNHKDIIAITDINDVHYDHHHI